MIIGYHPHDGVPPIGERYEGPILIGKGEDRQRVVVPYVVLREATIEEWMDDRRSDGHDDEATIQSNAQTLLDVGARIVKISVD